MEPIEINGIELLNDEEKKIANKLINEYYPKIQRQIKNTLSLRVHFKEYEKQGKRKKYSINVEASSPTKEFDASSDDWDFARAIHKVFNKIINQIEHALHSSEQH